MKMLMRTWRRVFGCTVCHRTGVIIAPGCDCGRPVWSLEPHEAYCSVSPCPHGCSQAGSRDAALAVWRRYWPAEEVAA